jgi:photosystem II stability/assembly factor-like uncharacterized protein
MKLFRIACGLILSLHTGVSLAAKWTPASSGLTGSVAGISHLVIDASGSTLYAAGNGLFRSTDGGSSWKLLSVVGVQVVALDPTSPSTIYAGTASGVLRSTDGGESWSPAGLAGHNVNILAVDPVTPSTLYAAAGDANIYKSTDAGQSWTTHAVGFPASAGPPVVSALLLDPAAPSTLYVLQLVGPPLYKSTDGAETWSVVNPGPVWLLAIDPATTPSTLYGTHPGLGPVFSYGFSKSTDGGATWTELGLNQPVGALAIDPRNSNTLYAATYPPAGSPPVIYKSTDGGQNWTAVNSSLPLAQALVVSPADSSTIYAPTNPVYAPGTGGIFKTTDAGMTWKESNTGLRVSGIQVLTGDPVDPATIYAGGDEGLFKSLDGGGSWSQLADFQLTFPGLLDPYAAFPPVAPAPVSSLLIDFTNPKILYAGTTRVNGCFASDILLYKSTDGGANWSSSINPENSGCSTDGLLAMDPTDPHTLYLQSGDDWGGYGLSKSTDGGTTWGFIGSADLNYVYALVIDPTSPATLYAGTVSNPAVPYSGIGGVQKSTDGGATWSVIGLAYQHVNLLAMDPLQPSVLYAGVFHWGLFKSADSGASWSPINNGLEDLIDTGVNVNALIVDPDQPDVLYLGTTGYGVFKSSDGGVTWGLFNEGLTFLDVRALAIVRGANPIVYAGTPGGVFKIVDPTNRRTPIHHRETEAKK